MSSNNKKSKETKKKYQQKKGLQKPIQQSVLIRIVKSVWLWIGVFLSLISYYFFFLPNVSISSSQIILDQQNPFKIPFFIYNKGNFPVYNFHYSLKMINFNFDSYLSENISFNNSFFDVIHSNIPKIKSNEKYTVSLMPLIGIINFSKIVTAKIFVKYSYESYLYPFTLKDSTQFKLSKDYQNNYVWIENPYN